MASVKCSVCLDPEDDDNRILKCISCDVHVHMLCYGIENFQEEWKCSPCDSSKTDPVCSICLQTGRAMKKTVCRRCALFTEGVSFIDTDKMEPIEITHISKTKKNKTCVFCQLSTGFCSLCCNRRCNNRLHITCAQHNKCLKEETVKNDAIKFRAYCPEHKPSDSSRRISAQFVRGRVLRARKEHRAHRERSTTLNADWITQSQKRLRIQSPSKLFETDSAQKNEENGESSGKNKENENSADKLPLDLNLHRSDRPKKSKRSKKNNETENEYKKFDETFNAVTVDPAHENDANVLKQANSLMLWWDTRDLRRENNIDDLIDGQENNSSNKENTEIKDHTCFKDRKLAKVSH